MARPLGLELAAVCLFTDVDAITRPLLVGLAESVPPNGPAFEQ